MKEKNKNRKTWLIGLVLVGFLLPSLVVLLIRMEKESPQVEFDLASAAFGKERNLAMTLFD